MMPSRPMSIPGVRSTMEDDLYVLLVDWEPISEMGATFKIYHNPLVKLAVDWRFCIYPGNHGGSLAGPGDGAEKGAHASQGGCQQSIDR